MSRIGNFSSSGISDLMSNGKAKGSIGKPFYTYIEEKIFERKSGRAIQKETSARPANWGTLVETLVFNNLEILGLEYTDTHKLRYVHEDTKLAWTGAPDVITETKVGDIKCPWSLKVYFQKAEIMMNNDVEKLKKDFPDNYWQLVSNSILTNKPIAELIIFCPYKDMLPDVRILIQALDEEEKNKYAFIGFGEDNDLPHLIRGMYYKDWYKMEWVVSEEDKQALYERVKLASEELNK